MPKQGKSSPTLEAMAEEAENSQIEGSQQEEEVSDSPEIISSSRIPAAPFRRINSSSGQLDRFQPLAVLRQLRSSTPMGPPTSTRRLASTLDATLVMLDTLMCDLETCRGTPMFRDVEILRTSSAMSQSVDYLRQRVFTLASMLTNPARRQMRSRRQLYRDVPY